MAERGPGSNVALAELRRARRRRRTEHVDLFETLYQAYLAALLSSAAVLVGSDVIGDQQVSIHQLAAMRQDGAAVLGLVGAVVVSLALRSGGQGGPLALEQADVLHVLLAPVDRRLALRPTVYARLRSSVALSTAVAAAAGVVAGRRLPGGTPAWIATAGVAGVGIGLMSSGAAMVVSGKRLSRAWASVAGAVVIAWSCADWVLHARTSPLTLLSSLALWPISSPPAHAAIGLLVAALVAGAGMALAGGVSLEAAERRSALVTQLRFAATLRDLRTVILVRRQLANERARRRPWLRLGPGRRPVTAVWKRDWEGLLRWPLPRILRVVALSAATGVALRGAWAGTTPLILVAGVALWLVALDAVEGLGQEVDHPALGARYPMAEGRLMLSHLPAAAVAMIAVAAVPAVLAALPGARAGLVMGLGAVVLVPGASCAVAGAALSTARGDPDPADPSAVLMPETAGFRLVVREALPPTVATAGLLPILAAREASRSGHPAIPAALAVWGVLALPVVVGIWLSGRKLQ